MPDPRVSRCLPLALAEGVYAGQVANACGNATVSPEAAVRGGATG
jgi:hypothetical protein